MPDEKLHWNAKEMEAMAIRWPRLPEEEQQALLGRMSRQHRRRFERALAKVHDAKRNYTNQMMTRQDTIQMLAMYIERNLVPMARRLDEAEAFIAFRRLPFYRRWYVTVMTWLARGWDLIEALLERFGITLVEVRDGTPEEESGQEETGREEEGRAQEAGGQEGSGEESRAGSGSARAGTSPGPGTAEAGGLEGGHREGHPVADAQREGHEGAGIAGPGGREPRKGPEEHRVPGDGEDGVPRGVRPSGIQVVSR